MWCLRAVVFLSFCYGYLADNRRRCTVQPSFNSTNFNNELRWDEHLGGEEPVLYSVSYRRYDDNEAFQPKTECQNITERSCDLTAETPTIPHVYYIARVSANGDRCRPSLRFYPRNNTTLLAPLLSTRVSGPLFHLNVTLPPGPGDTPLLETLNQSRSVYIEPLMRYNLTITEPSWARQVNLSSTGRWVLHLKNNNTQYCGYVNYKPNFGRPPSENAAFCVHMHKDPPDVVPWILLAAGLVVVLVVLVLVFVYLYTHPRKKPGLPSSMHVTGSSPTQPRLCSLDQNLVCSVALVEAGKLPVKRKPKPVPPSVPGGYFPQGDPSDDDDEEEEEEVGPRGRAPSECQSSVSYSHVIVNVAGEDAGRPDPAAGVPSVYRVVDRPRQDRVVARGERGDRAAKTLFLPTVRKHGELTLSLSAVRLQTADGDEEEEEEEDDVDEEKKTLLLVSDGYMAQSPTRLPLSLNSVGGSEDWGSDCDQSTANTTPTQLSSLSSDGSAGLRTSHSERDDATPSGYKQNCFNAGENTCGYGFGHWPRARPEEVGEGEEEEQGEGHVFLGGWVLQIRE